MKNLILTILCLSHISAYSNNKTNLIDEFKAFQSTQATELKLSNSLIEKLSLKNESLESYESNCVLYYKKGFIFYEKGGGKLLLLNDSGKIERIDKSNYSGDRFGAFVFVHNDTIYSIGGYGFWHVTGAVRVFNDKTKEWGIINTRDNIQIANGINAQGYYDYREQKLFVLYSSYPDEYIKYQDELTKQGSIKVQIFDLKTKEWSSKTIFLNKKVAEEINDLRIIVASANGLIIHSKYFNEHIFLSFSKNMLFKIPPTYITELFQLNNQNTQHISFAKDSSIFIYDLNSKELKSVELNNLIPINGEPLYTVKMAAQKKHGLNVLLGLSATILTLFISYKFKKKKTQIVEPNRKQNNTIYNIKADDFCEILDNLEISVLEKMLNNYQTGKLTSIEEINKIMNIEKRTYRIRNNMRADLLKIINKKFMDYSGFIEEVIIRVRSDFDKRYFQYSLNERFVNKIRLKNLKKDSTP
jgi:hypothetical protein